MLSLIMIYTCPIIVSKEKVGLVKQSEENNGEFFGNFLLFHFIVTHSTDKSLSSH